LIEEIPGQLVSAGVPQQLVDQFQSQGGSLDLTGTGDLGAAIMAQVPPQFQSFVQPYIDNIVAGIHEAFSIAVGATMWLGIAGALVAAVVVLFLKEQPLRAAYEMPAESGGDATNAEGAAPAGA
jgi:hypothetical protein